MNRFLLLITILIINSCGIGSMKVNYKNFSDKFNEQPSLTQIVQSSLATTLGGEVLDIFVKNDYAYVTHGSGGLSVFDVSGSEFIQVYHQPIDHDVLSQIEEKDGYLFISSPGSHIAIYSILNDPKIPEYITKININITSYRPISISGNTLFALTTNSLSSYNISEAIDPTYIGNLIFTSSHRSVIASGGYAYVSSSANGLDIIDVQNPSSMSYSGNYTPIAIGNLTYIAISGDKLFLGLNPIEVVDVANPLSPTFVKNLGSNYATSLDVYGDYLYAYIYGQGMKSFQISNDTNNSSFEISDVNNAAPLRVFGSGNKIFSAHGNKGIYMLDLGSDPLTPTKEDRFPSLDIPDNFHIKDNRYLIFTDENFGVVVIDQIDPQKPKIITKIELPVFVRDAKIVGNNYIVMSDQYLYKINISNIEHIVSTNIYDLGSRIHKSINIFGNYLYLLSTNNGLEILDITNIDSPIPKGSYNTIGTTEAIYVYQNIAFIADGSNGIDVLDVSDKDNILHLTNFPSSGSINKMFGDGSYLYAVNSYSSIEIYDLNSPSYAQFIGSYPYDDDIYSLFVDGDYLYFGTDWNGLHIVNVSTKSSPVLKTIYYSYESVYYDLYVDSSNKKLYAQDSSGYVIIDVVDLDNISSSDNYEAL